MHKKSPHPRAKPPKGRSRRTYGDRNRTRQVTPSAPAAVSRTVVRRMSRTWRGVLEGRGAMHGAAVVPHHEIARPPFVAIDETRLGRERDDARARARALPPAPCRRSRSRARRDRASSAPNGWRRTSGWKPRGARLAFLLVRLIAAELLARMPDRMIGRQPLEPRLHRLRQRIIGGADVGEFGIGVAGRDDARRQHRICRRDLAERAVGVPQAIGERIGPPLVVRASILP